LALFNSEAEPQTIARRDRIPGQQQHPGFTHINDVSFFPDIFSAGNAHGIVNPALDCRSLTHPSFPLFLRIVCPEFCYKGFFYPECFRCHTPDL
jgi:hypothetical protein